MRNIVRNPARATTRRVLAIHSAFGAVFLTTLFFFGALHTRPGLILVAIHAVSALCLAVDTAVSLYYFKKIEMAIGPKSFFLFFIIGGYTWEMLRAGAAEAEFRVGKVRVRALPFPQLDVESIIRTRGAEQALKVVERAEQKAQSDAQEAKSRERREAKRLREAAELLQAGIALGIPESEMRSLTEGSLDCARNAIAKKKRGNELLERAGRYCCTDVIQRLVKNGYLDEADAMLVKVDAIIGKARMVGIEERVRRLISADDLSSAENSVAEAEEQRAFELMREAHEQRISALPEHRRPRAREILNGLDGKRSNVREFRKALHELEQALAR